MWRFGSCLSGWTATHARSRCEGRSVELAAGLPAPPRPLRLRTFRCPSLTDRRVGVGHGPPGGEPVSFNETR